MERKRPEERANEHSATGGKARVVQEEVMASGERGRRENDGGMPTGLSDLEVTGVLRTVSGDKARGLKR